MTVIEQQFNSLSEAISHWGSVGRMGGRGDTFAEFTAAAPSLLAAVERACYSRDASNDMCIRQRRVPLESLAAFAYRIQLHPREVTEKAREGFDALYDYLWKLRLVGIGRATCHDVTVRLARFLEVAPTSVYLHTHAYTGWKGLTGNPEFPIRLRGRQVRVNPRDLPPPLQRLPVDQIQDFLAEYRGILPYLKTLS